jgi:hypothetical protein
MRRLLGNMARAGAAPARRGGLPAGAQARRSTSLAAVRKALIALGAGLCAAWGAWPGSAPAQDTPRDATRVEMVERFCGRNARCKSVTKAEIARGRTVQGVIVVMGETLLDRNWSNSDRAYDAMTRALLFTHDFMSPAEMRAGQTDYSGERAEVLRGILGDAAWICDIRGAFPSKYHCLKRRLVSFEPGWPPLPGESQGAAEPSPIPTEVEHARAAPAGLPGTGPLR